MYAPTATRRRPVPGLAPDGWLLFVLLFALAAALGLQKIRAFDYWWHLRTGALILEKGAVPKVDPYTYTVTGAPWVDIHWLFQLGLHGLHRLGGHELVIVAKVVLLFALVAILATIGWRRERPAVTVLGLGLMLLVACERFMPRPELPSFVLLAAVLALVDRHARRGDGWLWAVVPVQLVWVNVHGLFALGLGVLAMALAAELLHPLVSPGEPLRRDRLRRLALVFGTASLVSLANPNLLDGALYPLQQLGMVGPPEDRGVFGSLIAELIPPFASGRAMRPFALALAALSLVAMGLNWRRVNALDPLLWVSFGYLALGAQRNLALFGIVAATVFVRNANAVLDGVRPRRLARPAAAAVLAAALAFVCFDVASDRFFSRIGSYREIGLGPFELFYPIGAAEWIARHRPPGPICHHMADGGYLIWRLWPGYRVMADGRLEVFGEERFLELQVSGVERFRELDREHGFGAVLLHYTLVSSQDLLYWLRQSPAWRLVFVDEVAALYVRRSDAGFVRWPALDIDAPDLFGPLPPPGSGPSGLIRRFARVNFYTSMRRFPRALALWEETIAAHPELPQGPIIHAWLLHQSGHPAAAEAVVRRLLHARPEDARLHAQIGELRQEAGDAAAAKAAFERALELDPELSYAAVRRALLAQSEGDLETAYALFARVVLTSHPADPATLVAARHLRALEQVRRGP